MNDARLSEVFHAYSQWWFLGHDLKFYTDNPVRKTWENSSFTRVVHSGKTWGFLRVVPCRLRVENPASSQVFPCFPNPVVLPHLVRIPLIIH